MIRVYVDGQEGTTGLQIHELLAGRHDVELLRIALACVIAPELRKDAGERARLLNSADVAFLCLPDAAAKEAVALVENRSTCVIDASTAHRTAPGWVFGLPELAAEQRAAIRGAKRISNPGCHASAFILIARPLSDAGLIPAGTTLMATSITGYSGGGKKMIEQYRADPLEHALTSPRPYGLALKHKHVPEVMEHGRLAKAPIFVPTVASFYKGLAVSLPVPAADWGTTPEALHAAYAQRYAGERFIRVHPLRDPAVLEGGFFDVQGSNDSNRVDLFVFGNETQALVIARLDNLGKGASGAAVQAMNVHLGLDEGLGLPA
jgi:N-acetyl-gamma-glutamyl-phosphate reductase